ncbi:hypothetical protein ACL58G_23250 [Massilia sp. GER05]|uniref:hypothetical protein n=1 Tax=Massilia sp. GER05 TaxID=3394605 RepID=UPI003F879C1C
MRSLIAWLLLLALPFQGLAAARMLPSVIAPAITHATPVAQHCHATAVARADDSAHQHEHRGACGDCCIVVALVPVPLVPPAFPPPSTAIPFRAGHLASVDPPLLERPPRRLAA